jgi:hypothetical protein
LRLLYYLYSISKKKSTVDVWTISSPFIEGAGHLNLLLRGLNLSGSLWTFLKCTWGLAADCLSVSSNSPSFVNILTDEGHRLVNVYGRCSNKCHDEASSRSKKARNHEDSEPTNIDTVVSGSNPLTELVPGICGTLLSNCSSHFFKQLVRPSGKWWRYYAPRTLSGDMRDVIYTPIGLG